MSFIRGIKTRVRRLHYGLDTPQEFFLSYADRIAQAFLGRESGFYIREKRRKSLEGDHYRFKDIRFPLLNEDDERLFMLSVYEDTLMSYMYCNDDYSEKTFDNCDMVLGEGLYGLVNDKVNVTVKPGDIVIDAGAWIGDFAAYASVKGASVYAFEPTEKTFAILQRTAELNGNIIPVKKGLSDEFANIALFENIEGVTSANFLMSQTEKHGFVQASLTVETVRLDDFVRENNLPRVDFIKADIEGFERRMLAGAQETLARFAPKLALCTYHLHDDPQVMAGLIKQANPKYNIVQKRKKLFASVPQE